jgi:hypothetical protein
VRGAPAAAGAGFTARPAREDAGARFSDESFISSGDALKE